MEAEAGAPAGGIISDSAIQEKADQPLSAGWGNGRRGGLKNRVNLLGYQRVGLSVTQSTTGTSCTEPPAEDPSGKGLP